MTIFLSRIKAMRESVGLSQKRFAQKVGVSEMTVRRWETVQRSPSAEALLHISNVLNTSVAYLLEETDDPSPPSKIVQIHFVENDYEVDDFIHSGIPPLPENNETVNVPVSVSASAVELSYEGSELLRMYNSFDIKRRLTLLNKASELESEMRESKG